MGNEISEESSNARPAVEGWPAAIVAIPEGISRNLLGLLPLKAHVASPFIVTNLDFVNIIR